MKRLHESRGPVQSIFAFLNPLLGSSSAIVEVYNTFWLRKCSISTKVFPYFLVLIPLNDRFQNFFPTVSTVNIARPKHRSFTIPELIEAEQRMETGTPEMTVVG